MYDELVRLFAPPRCSHNQPRGARQRCDLPLHCIGSVTLHLLTTAHVSWNSVAERNTLLEQSRSVCAEPPLCLHDIVCVARRWAHHAAQELKEPEGAVSTTNSVLKITDTLLNCGLRLAAAMWLYANTCAGSLVNKCKAFSMTVLVFAGTSAGEVLGHFLH